MTSVRSFQNSYPSSTTMCYARQMRSKSYCAQELLDDGFAKAVRDDRVRCPPSIQRRIARIGPEEVVEQSVVRARR